MEKAKLDKITNQIATAFCNPDTFYDYNGDQVPYLIDVIASLHNLLYEEVTGTRYNYMFHWSNKGGYNGIIDNLFDEEASNENNN